MNTVDTSEVSTLEAAVPAQNMVLMPLSRLRPRPSKRNVRRKARTSIAALAASIRRLGLLQNLTVIPFGDDGDFEVVAGGRRLAALKLLAQKRRIVEGAFGGKLRFAPQVGRTLPLDVCAAYTECWRCKKTTGLVIDLCFAASRVLQGAADVTADIYDFDDEGRGAALLMSTLPASLLARHGIGPIKPRYSRTEGQSYLSNGCIHCDALQGRFFDHEVAYDAQPVFNIDVLFDDRWVSHLEDREAIDKWWFDDRPGEGAAEDAP